MKRLPEVVVFLLVSALLVLWVGVAYANDFPTPGYTSPICPVVGGDGGTQVKMLVQPNTQFMVHCSTYSGVRYKLATNSGVDSGSTDSELDVDKSIDLCAPSGYPNLVLSKGANDGGNPTCCVYSVSPATVCQIK